MCGYTSLRLKLWGKQDLRQHVRNIVKKAGPYHQNKKIFNNFKLNKTELNYNKKKLLKNWEFWATRG